ncbi:hypothetical protein Tco_0149821 [Tanacetum coccineum]
MFEQSSSSLVLHQMTSVHNCSELGIHDDSNEQSSSKLVPKVVPLAVKTATSRQELELLFHHHIAMLRTTGINPMIQPEPDDLPKDNPKLEIAVLRMKKKCMDKGSKERSPPHNLRQKPGQYICCQNHKLIADIENDIMDPVMQCTTLPSHSGFSQQKLVSFVTEIHTLSIDISLRDCSQAVIKSPTQYHCDICQNIQSDTNVFTMKMEILLESASNKLLVEHPSETIVFHNEDGNPARANIKQALGYLKDGDGDGNSQFLRCQVNNRMPRHDLHLL